MLLELVIGDAYGMAFEYAPAKFVETFNLAEKYVDRGRRTYSGVNRYGDDAQMSLAVAEVILSDLPWTKETFANKFVEVFHRDQRKGYAHNFYLLLKSIKTGSELLEQIKPESDKSGGAMRAPLIGIFPTIPEVIEKASVQASVTHNTPDGIGAAVASALTFHYFAYDKGDKKDLGEFIQTYVPGENWATEYAGAVGAKGWMSVRAAMTALKRHDTLKDILVASMAYTGDVDTVAAIAMPAASVAREIEYNMPQSLIDGLERGPYGYDYVYDLDCKLKQKLAAFHDAGW